jgi:gliding motility-associated-like protein
MSNSGAVSTITVNALPILTINSGSICTGNSFTLVPSGALTYMYSSGTNIVSPTTNTTYTVTGLSAQGCTNTAVTSITVYVTPTISVNSGSICSGNSFTLVPSGAASYNYSSGTNIVSPTTNTTYTVTGLSAQGCTNTAVSTISVNATPTISVNSGSICLGNSFTLISGGASTYTYSSGTNTVSPITNTNYTITGTSLAGCSSTSGAVSSVTVNAIPTLTLNTGTICSGNSFTLIPSGAATYTYSSGSSIVSPTTNTNYTVTGLSAQGCTNTAVTSVSVNTTPTISVNSGTICTGNSFTLVPSGASTYTYSSGTNVVSLTTNSTYTVSGTSTNGCISATNAVSSVTVNALPTLTVNSSAICIGDSYTISPSGATSYSFSSGSPVVNPTVTTSYTVTGANLVGCLSSAVITISITSTPTISVNNGTICSGNAFTMTPSGAASYTYSSGTNVVSPMTTTTYTLFGATASGCSSFTTSTVWVNTTPTISINSGSICVGNSFTLSPSGASSYTLSSGTAVVTPTTTTNYTITGSGGSGCLASKVNTVTVNAIPSLSVNSGTLCSGKSFTFTPSGAFTYTYSSGASVNSPTTNTSYTVTGVSAAGCISNAIATVSVIPLPALSVNSSTICAGQTATLTATGAVNYVWSTLALTNTLTVLPIASSSYTVLGAANGCTISAVSNVMVIPLPILTVNSTTICAGVTATLLATGASNYTWNTGATANPLIFSPSSTTSYTVVGSANGCTNSAVSNVIVNTVPIVTVNSETICVGQTTTLTATGALNYAWNTGALSSSLTVSPIVTTQYTVVGLSNGCSSFAISTVSVNPLPVLTINADTICSGQFASLYVSGASTYTWNNGINGNVIHVNPLTTTAYSVTGTTNNCSSAITTTVTVFASPLINFKSDVYYGCDSLCVNFTDLTIVSTGSIASWNWNFGNGVNASVQNPYYCYLDTGYYDVSLTITTTQGCAATFIKPQAISIFPSPIASFTFNPSTADVLNPTFDFTNQSSNAVSYQWSFGDSENGTQTDPSHAYLTEGVYTVTLVATSEYGCIDVTTNTLVVTEVFTFYAPNAFTPNEDRFNNVFKPIGRGWNPTTYQLDIFDRWGTLCFTSNDVTVGWDGRAFNGMEVAQIDTYTWKVKVAETTGKKHNYIGRLILLK